MKEFSSGMSGLSVSGIAKRTKQLYSQPLILSEMLSKTRFGLKNWQKLAKGWVIWGWLGVGFGCRLVA